MFFFRNNTLLTDPNDLSLSEGLLHGYGVFETILIEEKTPLFLEKHIQRLNNSLNTINLQHHLLPNQLLEQIHTLIKKNNVTTSALKILIFKNKNSTELLIHLKDTPYTSSHYANGFKLKISNTFKATPFPLCQIKSTNYLNYTLAKQEAIHAGFSDSLLLNQNNHICETTCANIFLVQENTIYTPSLKSEILPGICRSIIIDIAKSSGFTLKESILHPDQIKYASEAFITNSLLGIMPISQINNSNFSTGPITASLSKALRSLKSDYILKNKKPSNY